MVDRIGGKGSPSTDGIHPHWGTGSVGVHSIGNSVSDRSVEGRNVAHFYGVLSARRTALSVGGNLQLDTLRPLSQEAVQISERN